MRKAIVIGCDVGGLGVIRSLGIKGFKVLALSYDRTDFGQLSKFVHEKVKIPHPQKEERRFIDFLIKNSSKWKGALIIDTNDEVTVRISRNKTELANYYSIVTSDWGILRNLIVKSETYLLAEKCGVPYPMTFLPKSVDELNAVRHEIIFPCILKPVIGYEFMRRFNTKNFLVDNYNELLSKFTVCLESRHEVMVQEIIPGPITNLYNYTIYINSNYDIDARFLRVKIRQNPPRFGVTRVGLSKSRIHEVEFFTEKLLKEVSFRGIATAEFKKDPRDNQFKLLEINARMTRSNWLATYCGVNFPWVIYLDLVEGKQVEVKEYKEEVYWIELYQDIMNSVFRYREDHLGFRDFIRPYLAKEKTFAVISTEDLLPFLKQIAILPIKYYRFFKSLYSY